MFDQQCLVFFTQGLVFYNDFFKTVNIFHYNNPHKADKLSIGMIKQKLIVLGAFLIIWGGIGFVIPIADNGWSIFTFDQLCGADLGQEDVVFSDAIGPCQVSRYLIVNNYAYLGAGVGLVITGSLARKIF